MRKQVLFLKSFCSAFSFLLFSAFLVVYIADPLCYYRYSPRLPLHNQSMYQVAGFIRTFPFDLAIIGTSMTKNFSLKQIKEIFGGNPIKLSLAGMNIKTQLLIAEAAIKSKKAKTVIWGIDKIYFAYGAYPKELPTDMYKGNLFGHLQYLIFCLDNSSLILGALIKLFKPASPYSAFDALEQYGYLNDDYLFSKEIILQHFYNCFPVDAPSINKELSSDNSSRIKSFLTDFLPFIKKNPRTQFIMFFPPYSLAKHKLDNIRDSRSRALDLEFRQIILTELTKLPNVKMFDFETDIDVVSNLDNYMDFGHYSKHVNAHMIDSISKNKNLVTSKNIPHYQQKFMNLPKLPFK